MSADKTQQGGPSSETSGSVEIADPMRAPVRDKKMEDRSCHQDGRRSASSSEKVGSAILKCLRGTQAVTLEEHARQRLGPGMVCRGQSVLRPGPNRLNGLDCGQREDGCGARLRSEYL
jgi:hypothetical protein